MIGRAILHDLDLAKDLRTDLPDLALRSIAIVDQIISTDDLDTLWREVDRDEARLSRADLDLELADESEDRHLDLLPTDSRRGKSLAIDGITDILDLMDIGLCILLEADEHHLIAAIHPSKLDRILIGAHIPEGELEVPPQAPEGAYCEAQRSDPEQDCAYRRSSGYQPYCRYDSWSG